MIPSFFGEVYHFAQAVGGNPRRQHAGLTPRLLTDARMDRPYVVMCAAIGRYGPPESGVVATVRTSAVRWACLMRDV